jgi:hypothetical protein
MKDEEGEFKAVVYPEFVKDVGNVVFCCLLADMLAALKNSVFSGIVNRDRTGFDRGAEKSG